MIILVIPKIYTLPEVDFVGGATQDFIFYCYYHDKKEEYDLTGCTANFAVIDYVNKTDDPIISKDMAVSGNVAMVTLDSTDTASLYGKFIYQVIIVSEDGTTDIPGQGILHIANNINKSYLGVS